MIEEEVRRVGVDLNKRGGGTLVYRLFTNY